MGKVTSQQGFTYLMLMFSIVLIGLTITAAAQPWRTVILREQEADLLAYGAEIQQAIGAYSARMKAGRVVQGELYPMSLDALTRLPKPLLRKVYRDPITQAPFEVVRAPTGGVMGVRSSSKRRPLRQHNFPDAVRHFDGMKRYRDWVFQHPNASGSTVPLMGAFSNRPAMPGAGGGPAVGMPPPMPPPIPPQTGAVPGPVQGFPNQAQ